MGLDGFGAMLGEPLFHRHGAAIATGYKDKEFTRGPEFVFLNVR